MKKYSKKSVILLLSLIVTLAGCGVDDVGYDNDSYIDDSGNNNGNSSVHLLRCFLAGCAFLISCVSWVVHFKLHNKTG